MNVILTMDVPEIGSRGDRVDVAPGYARNYLIPRRLAVPATRGNLRIAEEEERLTGVRERKARREAEKIATHLTEHEVLATLKIGREGKAFGAITSKDLAILLRQTGLQVDRRRIRLDAPIRRLGIFEVPIHVHSDVETKVRVFVDREGGDKAGATREQETWAEAQRVIEEAERAEAEARAQREKEAEEAARLAIERAEARRKREAEEAQAREEAQRAAAAAEGGAAVADEKSAEAKAAAKKTAGAGAAESPAAEEKPV